MVKAVTFYRSDAGQTFEDEGDALVADLLDHIGPGTFDPNRRIRNIREELQPKLPKLALLIKELSEPRFKLELPEPKKGQEGWEPGKPLYEGQEVPPAAGNESTGPELRRRLRYLIDVKSPNCLTSLQERDWIKKRLSDLGEPETLENEQ